MENLTTLQRQEISQQRERLDISAAAHLAATAALHAGYERYEQPMPTYAELSWAALQSIARARYDQELALIP